MEIDEKIIPAHERAKNKVKQIKDFYNHLLIYLAINIPLLIFKISIHLIDFKSDILKRPEFFYWIYINAIAWGIALTIHGVCVFSNNPFFGKAWEERQIKKYMEKETRNEQKYK